MSVNVYQMVTDRIIAELEKGTVPWKKGWMSTTAGKGAFNRITKKPYSLLNQMLLGKAGEWATFKQWSELGGHIRKHERASCVVFWKITETTETNVDGETEKKTFAILKYYNVFHISQVDGVEPLTGAELNTEIEDLPESQELFDSYIKREGITFTESISDDAYYSPSRDLIHLPMKAQFTDIREYWSTAWHEVTHSTGHVSRLDRLKTGAVAGFGSEIYSREEMCAELGSAMMLNILGIESPDTFKNSASYISNWLEVLRNDNKFIVSASSKAEKAVNYILGN